MRRPKQPIWSLLITRLDAFAKRDTVWQTAMVTGFQQEYANLNDEELLHLASQRSALTDDAKLALDAEMQGRNLTAVDIEDHKKLVRRSSLHDTRIRHRKLFGSKFRQKSFVESLVSLLAMAIVIGLICASYWQIPARYRLPDEWERAATYVMLSSVFLMTWLFRDWGRRLAFWISLLISSAAHAFIMHYWIVHYGIGSSRADVKVAVFLGLILFGIIYGGWTLLRRKFSGEDTASSPQLAN